MPHHHFPKLHCSNDDVILKVTHRGTNPCLCPGMSPIMQIWQLLGLEQFYVFLLGEEGFLKGPSSAITIFKGCLVLTYVTF